MWCTIGLVTGVLWFFRGFKRLRLRSRILGLARSRIRSMAMGAVELDGRVRLETPIVDPIFQKACGYFRVVVEEQRGSGRNSRWVKIYDNDSSATPFLIEDSTGVARVSPFKADLQFAPEVNANSFGLIRGFQHDAVSQFVATIGSSWNSCRVTAHILREGQPLFLVGFASPATSASLSSRPLPRDAARIIKNDSAEMKKLDTNNDGVVDAEEWDAGVARKTRELNEQEATGPDAAPPSDPVITISCPADGVFVLADSEKALLARLDWSAWAGILGGPAAAIASAAYLLMQYGRLAPGIRHLTGLDFPGH